MIAPAPTFPEQIPDTLYKYTSDAGLAGLREGIVRFGSYQEYRDAEDVQIRDVRENSVLSRDVCIGRTPNGRAFYAEVLYLPGVAFCASLSASLRGVFPRYNHRIAIRTKPFISALREAMRVPHRIFEKDHSGKIVPPQFYDDCRKPSFKPPFPDIPEGWKVVPPSKVLIKLDCGKAQYGRDVRSNAGPQGFADALAQQGDDQIMAVGAIIPTDDSEFMKSFRFSREQEYRIALSFHPRDEKPIPHPDPEGGTVSRAYHVRSLYVKVDSPRDIFTLPR